MFRTLSEKNCGHAGSLRALLALALLIAWSGIPAAVMAEERKPLRWELMERPYDEMNIAQKIGSNLRKGSIGFVDSLGQGLSSAFAIVSPWGGFLASKVSTVAGDVVGLVDNNGLTKHVTRGILSRHLLRFGAGAMGISQGLGVIHDRSFEGPELELDDYVGDRAFHTDAYIQPGGITTLGAVVIADGIIRPIGSLITLFGFRETGDSAHEAGLDLIEGSLKVKYF